MKLLNYHAHDNFQRWSIKCFFALEKPVVAATATMDQDPYFISITMHDVFSHPGNSIPGMYSGSNNSVSTQIIQFIKLSTASRY